MRGGRNIFKIHAEYSSDERKGQEDCGYDGEDFHHFVQPETSGVQIDIHGTGNNIPYRVRQILDPHQVVVDIPEIIPTLRVDLCEFITGQSVDHLALGGDHPAQ